MMAGFSHRWEIEKNVRCTYDPGSQAFLDKPPAPGRDSDLIKTLVLFTGFYASIGGCFLRGRMRGGSKLLVLPEEAR